MQETHPPSVARCPTGPQSHASEEDMRLSALEKITAACAYGESPGALTKITVLPKQRHNFPKHALASFSEREFRASSEIHLTE